MSDLADLDHQPHALPRPLPPRTWRDRLDDLASVDPSPVRLAAVVGALAVAAVVAWRLLAPPAPPPEMRLPFAEQAAPGATAASPAADPAAGPSGRAPSQGDAAAGVVSGPGSGRPAPGGATSGEVVVHVVGAVAAPGVQRLPAGARVVDAVDAAGGATADADLARINLAAGLIDGQQVYVLRLGEQPPAPSSGATAGTSGGGGSGGAPGVAGGAAGLVNLNTASAAQLEELPGVGPTTAEAIIAHREQNGPFLAVDDLLDVRGIGEAKLEQVRNLVTV